MKYAGKFQLKDILQSIKLLEQEINSASDRSCAIVCAAFLDDFLERLLLSFLSTGSSSQNKLLFENNGPLSTFSAKIILAFRLGLISKKEYENITLVRKIRNAFAHDIKINSFDEDKIKSLLIEYIPDENLMPPIHIPLTLYDRGKQLDISPDLLFEIISDENKYSEIVEQFPQIKFKEFDKNSPRSIFTAIVHILHASLNSRLIFVLTDQRKPIDDFKDIVEIEQYKTELLNKNVKQQSARYHTLKNKAEVRIKEIEEKLASNHPDVHSLNELKKEYLEQLREIDEGISKLKSPISIEHAMQIHTYWLLKYQMLRKDRN